MKTLRKKISELKCRKHVKVWIFILLLSLIGVTASLMLWFTVFRFISKDTSLLFILAGYSVLLSIFSGIIYLYRHEF